MNKFIIGMVAAGAIASASGTANAAVNVLLGNYMLGTASLTSSTDPAPTAYLGMGLTLVTDFNSGTLAGNGVTGNAALTTGTIGARYAAPLNDDTQYLVIPETTAPYSPVGSGPTYSATVALGQNTTSVGFYWGSPDSYNNLVELLDANGGVVGSYTSNDLGSVTGLTGSNPDSIYVRLDSSNGAFSQIRYTTGNIAFEVDNIAVQAIPEPGEWAMMLAGLGVVSMIARRRKNLI